MKILTASDSIAKSFVIQLSAVDPKADHQLYFSGDHKKRTLLSKQTTVNSFGVIKKKNSVSIATRVTSRLLAT